MKAFVLAAGVGSRLRPWTDSHPKALVEVAGKPMIARVIENIIEAGITDIIVNVHHFAEQIEDYLAKTHFNAHIVISDERERLLDTGGALLHAADLIGDEPLLIHNADILTTLSLKKFSDNFYNAASDAIMLVAPRNSSRRLVFSDEMRLQGWLNLETGATKPSGYHFNGESAIMMSFNGIHIMGSSLVKQLSNYATKGTPFSVIDFYIDNCRNTKIMGVPFPADAGWWDVGKPTTLSEAQNYFSSLNK